MPYCCPVSFNWQHNNRPATDPLKEFFFHENTLYLYTPLTFFFKNYLRLLYRIENPFSGIIFSTQVIR